MATTKSKTAAKKSTAAKPASAAKTSTAKKSTAKKAAPKSTPKSAPKSSSSSSASAKKLAEQALKLMDDASKAIKQGVTHGAENADANRVRAKKQASVILDKGNVTLTKAINDVTSGLKSLINKIP